ncbi:MAG: CoA ester lyase [Deltaproteobacteria bacterium]|nr:CoA ester lyase [Deltaproteobacteria bacterium]
MTERLRRTLLFIPGGNEKVLNKGLGLEVDGLILDLEDSVAPDRKTSAREAVAEAIRGADFGCKEKVVRINALSTMYGREDIEGVVRGNPDTILVPKVDRAEDIKAYDRLIAEVEEKEGLVAGNIGLIALIESPWGVINIESIALACPRMRGLLFGAADFTRETRGKITADRLELLYPMMRILLAARIAGIDALDTPYFDIKDTEGLERHALQAKAMGYDGKALIHPGQIEVVNRIFTPTREEIDYAQRVIEAFQAARREGKGVIQLDGKMVENLHVAMAERILKIAEQAGVGPV